MTENLPALYWYAFWLVGLLGFLAYQFLAVALKHRRNMKALEVLKQYAEHGQEPPSVIAEQLAGQILNSGDATVKKRGASPAERRDELVKLFIGFLFSACLAWALNLWLVDADAARWAIYASEAARAFFGFGSFGLLLAAVLTRGS